MAERHTVDVDVEGSSPFRLPKESPVLEALFIYVISHEDTL